MKTAKYAGFAAFLAAATLTGIVDLKLIQMTGHHFTFYSLLPLALLSCFLVFAMGLAAMYAAIRLIRGGDTPAPGERIKINLGRGRWLRW